MVDFTGGTWRSLIDGEEVSAIPDSAVMQLRFDEGTGSIASDSVGNNDGTLLESAEWVSGSYTGDFAIEFNANGGTTDDRVRVDHDTDLNPGTDDFTLIATAMQYEATSGDIGIAVKYPFEDTVTPYYGFVERDDEFVFVVRDDEGDEVRLKEAISYDEKYRIAGRRDGDDFDLFINGELKTSTTDSSIGDPSNSENLNIGRHFENDAFPGVIDNVILHDKALSDEEISEDFANQPIQS